MINPRKYSVGDDYKDNIGLLVYLARRNINSWTSATNYHANINTRQTMFQQKKKRTLENLKKNL